MRNLVAVEFLTLDGVMESPEQWVQPYQTADIEEVLAAGRAASDALLLGRATYEIFAAYWPQQSGDASGIANYLDKIPKFVVSSSLKKADWNNTTIIKDSVADAIGELKRQPGRDIGIVGSGALVRSLMQGDLIDEYRLFVYPLVLGCGKRLFENGGGTDLKLVETATFTSGVVLLSYRRAQRA